jgi:hypothetical protein
MSDTITTAAPEKLTEKQVRKAIEEKIAITLLEFKTILGEKKFGNRIKKAGKLFSGDIVRLSAAEKPKKKKADKKVSDKK